jgi:hypothetical protein
MAQGIKTGGRQKGTVLIQSNSVCRATKATPPLGLLLI